MTTIEKIKQARIELDKAFSAANDRVKRHLRVRMSDMEALQAAVKELIWLQAEALVEAEEKVEESAAKVQKLSDQIQESERHIERLAERRSDEDRRIIEALDAVIDYGVITGPEWVSERVTLALALAKGEAA